ncbi:MAG TPA: hypothetical protein VFN39_01805, partial [Gemmatimonadaceae bacterium]|nr:hypothetical protein [Gemmatimonadaceae bacterium]
HALARAPALLRGSGSPVPVVAGISLCLTLFAGWFAWAAVGDDHSRDEEAKEYQRNFLSAIDELPARKAIIFVRYKPDHDPHLSLLYNDPDLAESPRWIVYDRGADNSRLMRVAPDRRAFLFDEARDSFHSIAAAPDSISRP